MDMTEIRDVSWIGDECLCQPVRGVVLAFHGLGQTGGKQGPTTEELAWGAWPAGWWCSPTTARGRG